MSSSSLHTLDIRIYYEDTDAGGVVYHANYMKFAERARTEYLRDLGFTNSEVRENHNVIFVVRHAESDYLAPMVLDDLVQIETRLVDMKRTSFTMNHKITRAGVMIFDMTVVLVCVDWQAVKPVRIPDVLRKTFEKDLNNNE